MSPVGVRDFRCSFSVWPYISKWKIVRLRRPPACWIDNMRTTRLPKRTTVPGQACYVLRWWYKLRTTDLQRSAGGRDSLGNLGYSFQVQCSLVHRLSHAQPFVACRTLLAVRQVTKSWAWDWERGYYELETADRQWWTTIGYIAGPTPSITQRMVNYWHAVRQFVRRAPQCPAFS